MKDKGVPVITPHPVLALPSRKQAEEMGEKELKKLLDEREELIRLEREDPYHHGFEPEIWKTADALREECSELVILGGNRSSKSTYAALAVVKTLVEHEDSNVVSMHTTASTSIEQQQALVWHYLPKEWKTAKKSRTTNLTYSVKNGFTEGSLVGPNGSKAFFRNYSQKAEGIMEGSEWDLAWCDELCPLSTIEALRFRLITRANMNPRNGLILTFTPIAGWSNTVKAYLQGARTVESAPAELLGGELVPVIQQCVRPAAKIMYFHTKQNPYNDYGALVKTLEGEARHNILCRAYGIPQRQSQAAFPLWGEKHLVNADQIPEEGTNYMVVDPSNGKNWVMAWFRAAPNGVHYCYREWPSVDDYIPGVGSAGEWAIAGKKMDGDVGPAQQTFGFSLERYREEIERVEGGEAIFLRIMDSRFGASPTPTKEGVTTLIDQMGDLGLHFVPASGVTINEGVQMVSDMIHWKPHSENPEDPSNCPRFYLHEDCKNMAFALTSWTGADGKHGATKDFVDLARMYFTAVPSYVDLEQGVLHAGGYY